MFNLLYKHFEFLLISRYGPTFLKDLKSKSRCKNESNLKRALKMKKKCSWIQNITLKKDTEQSLSCL